METPLNLARATGEQEDEIRRSVYRLAKRQLNANGRSTATWYA
jgi:hypothetical protein